MNNFQLTRNLQSVGKTCFVEYFVDFLSMSRVDAMDRLKAQTDYTEKSCASRTSHARSIIEAGLAGEALRLIISSESVLVSAKTRTVASELLKRYKL